jgi:hypothetical protein
MPEYSFIACDYPCSSLIEAAHRAETDRERNLFLCFLLEYFEFVLWNHLFVSLDRGAADWLKRRSGDSESPKPDVGIMLNAARYCLRDEICHEPAWHWVRGLIDKAGGPGDWAGSLRSLLTVYVLCPVLTEPIAWDDPLEMWSMEQILECQREERLRWAVCNGFTESTLLEARATLARFNDWRRSMGKPPLEIDESELEERLTSYGGA